MTEKIRKRLISLPLLGYSLRILRNIYKLPHYLDMQQENNNKLSSLISSNKAEFNVLKNEHEDRFNKVQFKEDSLQAQLSLVEKNIRLKNTMVSGNSKPDGDLFANDHLLDIFYTNFEDRFRGSEEMIVDRLKDYLPDFINSKIKFNKTPVLDIGSGRGELLQLLKENGVKAEGLDINLDMVERANKKGLVAKQGDALEFLEGCNPQTFGAITGFHIVEHIPFPSLLRLFLGAHKALVPEGFVIFETPNPENIIVGSCAFYMDPSHLNPLPPDLLAFALETCGFHDIEIRRIHPVNEHEAGKLPKEFVNRFYGPRDYAVVAFK